MGQPKKRTHAEKQAKHACECAAEVLRPHVEDLRAAIRMWRRGELGSPPEAFREFQRIKWAMTTGITDDATRRSSAFKQCRDLASDHYVRAYTAWRESTGVAFS